MARKEAVRIIDGKEYTFYKRNAIKSLVLGAKLLKIIGPGLGTLIEGAIKGSKGKEFNVKDIIDSNIDLDFQKGIEILCDRIDPEQIEPMAHEILSQTIVKGHGEVTQDNFQAIFESPVHLLKVLAAALKAEYSDFLVEKPAQT